MKRVPLLFLIAVLGVLMAATAYGADTGQSLARDYGINGYSIAYSENGEITFQSYGNGIDEKSVFELASNGKVVSAYIALKLVDEGKLSLEEKITPYLKSGLLTDDTSLKRVDLSAKAKKGAENQAVNRRLEKSRRTKPEPEPDNLGVGG